MSTTEMIASIKLSSPVIYVDGDGIQHGAIAKGPASVGYNAGLRTFGAFLNLIYLNDEGVPVAIASAPLLSSEQDDKFIKLATDALTERDLHATANAAGNETPEEIQARHFVRMTEQPRTIGWKLVGGDEATAENIPIHGELGGYPLALTTRIPVGVIAMHPETSAEILGNKASYTKSTGGDYSQENDPYGIAAEYTGQSAAVDRRGNEVMPARSIPTQEEADKVAADAEAEMVARRSHRFDNAIADEPMRKYNAVDAQISAQLAEERAKSEAEMNAAEQGHLTPVPSAADLDRIAEEQKAKEATDADKRTQLGAEGIQTAGAEVQHQTNISAQPPADEPAPQTEAAS